jgi:hypothetical protein
VPIDADLRERAARVTGLTHELEQLRREGHPHLGRGGEKSEAYLGVLRQWTTAVGQFYDPLDDLVLGIRKGLPDDVERGIVYLETAPRCFRSGYLAEALFRCLSRAPLTSAQEERCRSIVMTSLTIVQARGWREVGALAGAVWSRRLAVDHSRRADRDDLVRARARVLVLSAAQWCVSSGRRLPMDGLSDELRATPDRGSLPWRLVRNWRSLPVLQD